MSARTKIVKALVDLINSKLNGASYKSNIYRHAEGKLKFWDEINSYPYISLTAGDEYREYLPSDFKWGFLTVNIRIYVKTEKSLESLEGFMEDIEALLDANNDLIYDTGKTIEEIRIMSISTDEGVMHPRGVGELQLQIRYDV